MNITTWKTGPPPRKGQFQQYPGRFIFNLKKYYPDFLDINCLHMFSGACEFGISTDLREETGADFSCDYREVSNVVGDYKFDAVLCDPPYSWHWANQWHADLPKPKLVLEQASKVVKTGGLIGLLHIVIVPAYKKFNIQRIGLHPILVGPNNAVRIFSVFRKL